MRLIDADKLKEQIKDQLIATTLAPRQTYGESNIMEQIDAMPTADTELTKRLRALLHDCRNDFCIVCERYREAHLGACNGCRWAFGEEWEKI